MGLRPCGLAIRRHGCPSHRDAIPHEQGDGVPGHGNQRPDDTPGDPHVAPGYSHPLTDFHAHGAAHPNSDPHADVDTHFHPRTPQHVGGLCVRLDR